MADPEVPSGGERRPLLPPVAVLIALLVLLAVLTGTERRLSFNVIEGAKGAMRVTWPWWRSFLASLGDGVALVPFFVAIAWIVRKAPLERGQWGSSVLRHLAGMLLLCPLEVIFRRLVSVLVNLLAASWSEAMELHRQTPLRHFVANSLSFVLVYLALATLIYAWDFRRRQQEKERLALTLERQLAQTQMHMLRMQLNPHFLFNTLNSLGTLMRRDVETAEEMLLALTDFLRSTLEGHGSILTPLRKELALAERYAGIEKVRFPNRLVLEQDIDPGTLTMPVPSFLLQPLVENAIKHGIAPRSTGGTIWIRSRQADESLVLEVEDDGLGAEAPQRRLPGREGSGVGLTNTRERLERCYRGKAMLEAGPRAEGGYRVRIRIPLDEIPYGPEVEG